MRPRPNTLHRLRAGAAAFLVVTLGEQCARAEALPARPPATPDALASVIRDAIGHSDIDTLSGLVDWDGASPFKRHVVTFDFLTAFNRKIRSVAVEPRPDAALKHLAEFGGFKANLEITRQIRVVFDDAGQSGGHVPDMVFLIGQQGGATRIALVNPLVPSRHQ